MSEKFNNNNNNNNINNNDLQTNYLGNKINNNPIFRINKEEEPQKFSDYFDMLYTDTFQYVCRMYCRNNIDKSGMKDSHYGDFALELRAVLETCIEWYDENIGPFINLFNYAFAKMYKRRVRNNDIKPVVKDRDEEIKLRDYLRYLGFAFEDAEIRYGDIRKAAKSLNLDPDKVEKIILKKRMRKELPEILRLSEEDEINLIDESAHEMSTDEYYINFVEGPRYIIECAQYVYDEACDSQKPIIRLCFTADVCKGADVGLIDISGFEIIDDTVVLPTYIKEGKILSQKELAIILQKKETAVCRVYSDFKRKLKDYLETVNGR